MSDTDNLIHLQFYIAGDGFFSRQALSNLESLVSELENGVIVKKEVTDVTDNPAVALEKGIFTTPTLIASVASRKYRFVGDLGQRELILDTLKPRA